MILNLYASINARCRIVYMGVISNTGAASAIDDSLINDEISHMRDSNCLRALERRVLDM